MTTETSNARGEVVAWEARDPDDGTRWVTRHASERDGWLGLGRTIRPLIYGDAPPPAAARGDVRGLVGEMAEVAAQIRASLGEGATVARRRRWAQKIEAALAAEGVQAGEVSVEVKIRARELLAQAFEANGQHVQAAFVRKGRGEIAPEKVAIAAIAAALSQQPEARGVVDALSAQEIERGWEATFSTTNPFCPCDLKSFTKAVRWAERALTGERNG